MRGLAVEGLLEGDIQVLSIELVDDSPEMGMPAVLITSVLDFFLRKRDPIQIQIGSEIGTDEATDVCDYLSAGSASDRKVAQILLGLLEPCSGRSGVEGHKSVQDRRVYTLGDEAGSEIDGLGLLLGLEAGETTGVEVLSVKENVLLGDPIRFG